MYEKEIATLEALACAVSEDAHPALDAAIELMRAAKPMDPDAEQDRVTKITRAMRMARTTQQQAHDMLLNERRLARVQGRAESAAEIERLRERTADLEATDATNDDASWSSAVREWAVRHRLLYEQHKDKSKPSEWCETLVDAAVDDPELMTALHDELKKAFLKEKDGT